MNISRLLGEPHLRNRPKINFLCSAQFKYFTFGFSQTTVLLGQRTRI